ncbi:MAG: cephalosporin hydroxylase family protein [Deltaproteobacteria bacterium]|nr:cephalosporin hydroxylase family protein [Deltaproteobacteria bacterium]
MKPLELFALERRRRIREQAADPALQKAAARFMTESIRTKYSYNFSWLGVPVIQYPQDLLVMQEVVWAVKPDLIIETGVAHGGSLIFYASLLELLGGEGRVLGLDIEIRPHNREAIEKHPLFRRIALWEGDSTAGEAAALAREMAAPAQRVLVCLDSNHTHAHVLKEMELYAPLVTPGSYLVVFDTIVEHLPDEFYTDRPWSRGDNPATAVRDFLARHPEFAVDEELEGKAVLTVAPGGYLRRIS